MKDHSREKPSPGGPQGASNVCISRYFPEGKTPYAQQEAALAQAEIFFNSSNEKVLMLLMPVASGKSPVAATLGKAWTGLGLGSHAVILAPTVPLQAQYEKDLGSGIRVVSGAKRKTCLFFSQSDSGGAESDCRKESVSCGDPLARAMCPFRRSTSLCAPGETGEMIMSAAARQKEDSQRDGDDPRKALQRLWLDSPFLQEWDDGSDTGLSGVAAAECPHKASLREAASEDGKCPFLFNPYSFVAFKLNPSLASGLLSPERKEGGLLVVDECHLLPDALCDMLKLEEDWDFLEDVWLFREPSVEDPVFADAVLRADIAIAEMRGDSKLPNGSNAAEAELSEGFSLDDMGLGWGYDPPSLEPEESRAGDKEAAPHRSEPFSKAQEESLRASFLSLRSVLFGDSSGKTSGGQPLMGVAKGRNDERVKAVFARLRGCAVDLLASIHMDSSAALSDRDLNQYAQGRVSHAARAKMSEVALRERISSLRDRLTLIEKHISDTEWAVEVVPGYESRPGDRLLVRCGVIPQPFLEWFFAGFSKIVFMSGTLFKNHIERVGLISMVRKFARSRGLKTSESHEDLDLEKGGLIENGTIRLFACESRIEAKRRAIHFDEAHGEDFAWDQGNPNAKRDALIRLADYVILEVLSHRDLRGHKGLAFAGNLRRASELAKLLKERHELLIGAEYLLRGGCPEKAPEGALSDAFRKHHFKSFEALISNMESRGLLHLLDGSRSGGEFSGTIPEIIIQDGGKTGRGFDAEYREFRQAKIDKSRRSVRVLVCSRRFEGLDLPGNAARFNILFEAPFESRHDTIVKSMNNIYPTYEATRFLSSIFQWAARCVRNSDDHACTIVLDRRALKTVRKYARGMATFMIDQIQVMSELHWMKGWRLMAPEPYVKRTLLSEAAKNAADAASRI